MTKVLGIIIGSGGTGAKVAEAMIHATAAGLGPDRLVVGLVDQDGGNGNTSRARLAVEAYADARRLWRTGSQHVLGNDIDLLRPEIELISDTDSIWVPHPDGNTTLDSAVGQRDAADDALFNALFEAGPTEQKMAFEVGYRARPNVGALAMALAMQDRNHPFVKAITTAIAQASQGWSVRLIIAGSIFGGTGAAGLPTLARLLRAAVPASFAGQFRMAGVLMLPYFSFDPPPEGKETFADANQFLASSRAAVTYYQGLQMRGQLPFDQAFVVGWDPLFAVGGRFAEGGAAQANPAMPPELVASLAGCGFCRGGVGDAVVLVPRAAREAIEWTDLPSPEQPDKLLPFHRLGHLLRFAVAWSHWDDLVGVDAERRFGFGRHPFFKKQGLNNIDWKKSPPESERAAMTRWTDSVLGWARMLAQTSQVNRIDFRLWRAPPATADLSDTTAYASSYDDLIQRPETITPLSSASDLDTLLSNEPGPATAKGLGRLAAQLHFATLTQ